MVCLQIPMAIKFFLYFGLYWTLPHDRIEEVEDTGGALLSCMSKCGTLLV